MKKTLLCCSIFPLGMITMVQAQSMKTISDNLKQSYSRIQYWHENSDKDKYDSLAASNKKMEKLILKYTAENPATLSYSFKTLLDSTDIMIRTSKDGLFRIYTWYNMSGGSARSYVSIFQYKSNGRVHATILKTTKTEGEDEYTIEPLYQTINQVNAGIKTYYITQSIVIASSALYGHTTKIFTLDNGNLNDTAKLIMTKTGLHNELSYEVDWPDEANRNSNLDNNMDYMYSIYDAKRNIISIPLIDGDGRVTTKRIRYKFNGKYFVKL